MLNAIKRLLQVGSPVEEDEEGDGAVGDFLLFAEYCAQPETLHRVKIKIQTLFIRVRL